MGISKESQRSTDEAEGEVIIPFEFVPYPVRRELIKKLNPDSTLLGNDWRMLASELGYTTGEITYIESEKDNNTAVLFKQYDTKPGASLNNVCKALEKMERKDCQDIIINAMPEIYQAYIKASEAQTLRAAKTSEMLSAREHYQWQGSPYSCPYTHNPTSVYGSHPYYQCSHSFANCGGACHSHLGNFPSPYHAHVPQPHHSMCPTYSHTDTVVKACEPGFSSPCHTTLAAHGYLMSPQPNCHGNVGQPLVSGSPSRQGNSPNIMHNTQGKHHGRSGFSPGHSNYKGSPTYNQDQNDGLMATSDIHSLKYRQRDNIPNNGMMINDPLTALSETYMRQQGNNMPLPNNIIVFDDNSLLSSDSSNSDSLNNRQKVARQYSDECNITQLPRGDKRFRNNNSRETLNSEDSIDQCCAAVQGVTGHSANNGFKPKNNNSPKFAHPVESAGCTDWKDRRQKQDYEVKVRNGPGMSKYSSDFSNQTASCNEAKTSLAFLERLATVPDKFKPTDEYKKVVAEQKIEVDKRRREGKDSTSSSSPQSSNGSPFENRLASNFPMNMKGRHDPTMEEFKHMAIDKLSTSVPQIPKPSEYKKTFCHIKVFVTYSYDNESHGKLVLSLCKFLQTNGFACCVDVREKKTTSRSLGQLEWCRKKVLQADFVLVCISQKYIEDISTSNSAFSTQIGERQLHTREIYELMNSEYLNNQHSYDDESNSYTISPHRFIPLLFEKMTTNHVPLWMKNGPIYAWPQEYKDLAWWLTKPQERIMGRRGARREQLEEQEQRDSDLDVASGMDMTNLMSSVLCSS